MLQIIIGPSRSLLRLEVIQGRPSIQAFGVEFHTRHLTQLGQFKSG